MLLVRKARNYEAKQKGTHDVGASRRVLQEITMIWLILAAFVALVIWADCDAYRHGDDR